ncbi:Membrane protein involved in the export of O-antigen and teichoic acid [Sphingomonas guangdongensis]|uniref:Membrane protein involved in the export of O-antigen and teichoic acid n=1 Tax=Sphingomonas guangdongensis TaxID=1141890 RepID=A0A285QLY0_9SPHN|nr:lipopolysaccharide biosynthesis protein [Sphingomonas guangdongensis]SOB81102.1 Membrane protein involved in the export of O-antigen and teichoic acid [Sphingomonas guangdongensis]
MVRKALFWSFSGNGATMLVTFAGSIVIARLLSPREMGVYAVAMATIGIIQLFAAFGVGSYVIREIELTSRKLDAAFTINLVLSIALAIAIFLLGRFGAFLLSEPTVASVLQLLAINPILGALSFRSSVMLQRAMLFRGTSIIGVLAMMITTGVTIIAALRGESSMSPAYGAVTGALFGTLGTILIAREHWSMRLSLFEWRKITAFGLRIMSIGGISQASARVMDIVVAHFLGLAALGLYSRALNLNNLIFGNIYAPMTRVVFAKLSEAQREGDRVADVFLRGLRMIIALIGPLVIGLAVLAKPAILLLYGERWMGAAIPLSLILVSHFITLSFAMNWELFLVRDELKVQTRLEISRSLFGVLTQVIGSLISLVAVAASSIVDAIFSLLLYSRHMPRLAQVEQSRMIGIYAEGTLLTAVAALPCFVLMMLTGWDSRTSLLPIAGTIAVGVVAWLLLLKQMKHPLMDEIELLVSQLAGRIARRHKTGAAEQQWRHSPDDGDS